MDWVFDTDGKPITPVTIVTHQTINGKYRIQFERVGSANKTDGVKVEVNGDSLEEVLTEARTSYEWAINHLIPPSYPSQNLGGVNKIELKTDGVPWTKP